MGVRDYISVGQFIDTGDSRPIKQPPRRVPLAYASEERNVIQQMEAQGIIRKSSSPWASPIVLVKKKNGKTRCCIDYRRLYGVTQQDAFPLPRIQDCLDTVRGSIFFSTFDLSSGYHQVPLRRRIFLKLPNTDCMNLPLCLWGSALHVQHFID